MTRAWQRVGFRAAGGPLWLGLGSVALALLLGLGQPTMAAELTIVTPEEGSALEQLAAREVRRYVYLTSGDWAAIQCGGAVEPQTDSIVVARADRPVVVEAGLAITPALGPQEHALITQGRTLYAVGGDDVGTLYAAYLVAESLGVRFAIEGDVLPESRRAWALPQVQRVERPLFATRGIQPFHDFPEGPDWWTQDDYLANIGQLAKLRMNFLGLHCYPEGPVGPEPGVWIGRPEDLAPDGLVTASYPAMWASTARDGRWGYAAMLTSAFAAGASGLFPVEAYGSPVQGSDLPAAVAGQNAVFNRTGAMLREVFAEARGLGLTTVIGTETPLTVPRAVQDRLRAEGKDPADPEVVRALYRGMFERIAQTHELDYYWLWTPENWTWGGNTPEEWEATERDIRAALGALEDLGHPFQLATCGWVLGPQNDRAALDRLLPDSSPMSCINRQVGHAPVEPAFGSISGRPLWAIPWLENDPNMVAMQPWVGRMRADAVDAKRLGCTGLIGIHWRTRAIAPNVSALAAAGWDQSWAASAENRPADPWPEGPVGGEVAAFGTAVEATSLDAVYQTVRYGMDAYVLDVPAGVYSVTLQLNEPHYREPGKRVFSVSIQGVPLVESLDLLARTGGNRALDLKAEAVRVDDPERRLRIEFQPVVEFPCVAGIVVTGQTQDGQPYERRIDCGASQGQEGYEADLPAQPARGGDRRAMPAVDFYQDLAATHYGPEAAEAIAAILLRIDGRGMPEPSAWLDGPGALRPESRPWAEVSAAYAFVDELEALQSQVVGATHQARFQALLHDARAMRAMAQLGCLRGALDAAIKRVEHLSGEPRQAAAQEALELRLRLSRLWEQLITHQVAVAATPGDLGTIANLEQHTRWQQQFLTRHDEALAVALGAAGLPAEVELSREYRGEPRVFVPTVRTRARPGESLIIPITVVSRDGGAAAVSLYWRPLGNDTGPWQPLEASRLGRGVYQASIPVAADDFEYRVEARLEETGAVLSWPVSPTGAGQSVVVGAVTGMPAEAAREAAPAL